MYLDTSLAEECRGCGACAEKCPVHAISMEFKQGFQYPNIDLEKCIHCDLCRRVCKNTTSEIEPRKDERDVHKQTHTPKCFYGWTLDREQRLQSTSGGAFPGIAQSWMELHPDAWVYGAVYDEENHVIHTGVQDKNGLLKMCRSKYVQSDMNLVFQEIADRIHNREYVMFSGTPCQVAALKTVIGIASEYLLTVEFVCHGVMSPKMFEKYLEKLGNRKHTKVKSYSFRNKKTGLFKKSLRMIQIEYADGSVLETENDLLVMAYKNKLFYRASCHFCPYATTVRCADFTIGDFWGIEKYIPQLKQERINGISMVMLNTELAEGMEETLRGHMLLKEPPAQSLNYGQMVQPTVRPKAEVDMEQILSESDIVKEIRAYLPFHKRFLYLHPTLMKVIHKVTRKVARR